MKGNYAFGEGFKSILTQDRPAFVLTAKRRPISKVSHVEFQRPALSYEVGIPHHDMHHVMSHPYAEAIPRPRAQFPAEISPQSVAGSVFQPVPSMTGGMWPHAHPQLDHRYMYSPSFGPWDASTSWGSPMAAQAQVATDSQASHFNSFGAMRLFPPPQPYFQSNRISVQDAPAQSLPPHQLRADVNESVTVSHTDEGTATSQPVHESAINALAKHSDPITLDTAPKQVVQASGGSRGTNKRSASGETGPEKPRRKMKTFYDCRKCGEPKRGHVCPYDPDLTD